GHGRCAAAAVSVQEVTAHDTPGIARRGQGVGREAGDEAAHPPNAANLRAPLVLGKGVDLVAQNIRRLAEEHRVPVFESPKLARALYRSTDLNKEIPAGLYVAVAQVLSYIFRVRTLNPTIAARVARPNPQVSGEFDDA